MLGAELETELGYEKGHKKINLQIIVEEVYTAIGEELAYEKLTQLEEKWGKKYPYAIKSWHTNWDVLLPLFKLPSKCRRIMYATNIIERLRHQFSKVIKTESIFPSD